MYAKGIVEVKREKKYIIKYKYKNGNSPETTF